MSDPTELERAVSSSVELGMAHLAGKYMMFEVAQEAYGLPILDVREIDGLMPITRLPGSPELVRGVIDLRGSVIPVIDLGLRLGMPATVASEQTVVIVVQGRVEARAVTVGLLVDRVLEVVSLEASHIEPPPDLASSSTMADFLVGVGKLASRVVLLLDVTRILAGADRPMLDEPLASAERPPRGSPASAHALPGSRRCSGTSGRARSWLR